MWLCAVWMALVGIWLWSHLGHWYEKDSALVTCKEKGQITQKENVSLTGTVWQVQTSADTICICLKDISCNVSKYHLKEAYLMLYTNQTPELKIGNKIQAKGILTFYEGPDNPGNFDSRFYYAKSHIYGKVWAKNIEKKSNQVYVLRQIIHTFKQKWEKLLLQTLGEQTGGVLGGILLGEKSYVDPQWKEYYQKNGIGHILAISGLHVSFLGYGLYQLLRKIGLKFGTCTILVTVLLAFYGVMSGLQVSTIRAIIMFVIRMGAEVYGRKYDVFTSGAVAMAVIVSWQPLYFLDAGFLLSFAAIAGIEIFTKLWAEDHTRLQGLLAGAAIWVMTVPLQLYFFYEIPLYATLLNLVVVPGMSLVMALGLLGSASAVLFLPMGKWMLSGSGWILNGYYKICDLLLELPLSRLVLGKPQKWQVGVYYVGLYLLYRLWRTHKKWAVGIWTLGIVVLVIPFATLGKTRLTMLSIGQGDCIYFSDGRGTNCLMDGGSSTKKNISKYQIEPYLESIGVGALDYVFLSHGDSDHTNGIAEMIERQKTGVIVHNLVMPPRTLWDESLLEIAKEARKNHVTVYELKPGDVLKTRTMRIQSIYPEAHTSGEIGNETSMVLKLQLQSTNILLTGDLEGAGEEKVTGLLQKNPEQFQILKVAHHGSKGASSAEFLSQTHARVGLISAGVGNRYGHPSKETLKRLKDAKIRYYSTMRDGAIELLGDETSMWIKK